LNILGKQNIIDLLPGDSMEKNMTVVFMGIRNFEKIEKMTIS